MGSKEPDSHDDDASENGHKPVRKHQSNSGYRHCNGKPEHLAPAEPSGEGADPGRARAAKQGHDEAPANGVLPEMEGRSRQPEADIVVDRHERAHQEEGL